MKPRTKIECEIVELSRHLPEVTTAQLASAQRKCFTRTARALKNGKIACLECGNQWIDKHPENTTICPHCACKLKVAFSTKENFKDDSFFAILDVVAGYQVVRLYDIRTYKKVGKVARYAWCEVVQRWMMPKGRKESVILAVGTSNGSYCWSSTLEVRNEFYASYGYQFEKYNPIPYHICPGWRVWPDLKRNGFRGEVHGIAPHKLFKAIRSNTIAETLLKSKQHSLLEHYIGHSSGSVCDYWRSICICNRNKYTVQDAGMWIDYLSMLKREGKDILNAIYICPKDLKKAHDELSAKIQIREKREQKERERLKALENEKTFKELKSKYFGVEIVRGDIQIKVLDSIEAFLEEGAAMHHCVFSGAYYLKPDSLVLSATIKGVRVETVEVSLKTLKVVQSRGVCNSQTAHHDKIIRLVNREIKKQIKSRLTA